MVESLINFFTTKQRRAIRDRCEHNCPCGKNREVAANMRQAEMTQRKALSRTRKEEAEEGAPDGDGRHHPKNRPAQSLAKQSPFLTHPLPGVVRVP